MYVNDRCVKFSFRQKLFDPTNGGEPFHYVLIHYYKLYVQSSLFVFYKSVYDIFDYSNFARFMF